MSLDKPTEDLGDIKNAAFETVSASSGKAIGLANLPKDDLLHKNKLLQGIVLDDRGVHMASGKLAILMAPPCLLLTTLFT